MVLLGLDIGTSSIKAVAYESATGKVISLVRKPTPVVSPAPGLSEYDPERLWLTAAACLREITASIHGDKVAAVCLSSFGEVGVPLCSKGKPLYPAVAWFDTRCASQTARCSSEITPGRFHEMTGQQISTSLGVNKWMWFRENEPLLAERTRYWLSVPDYLGWRLTGERVTDYSIASRTGLFDAQRKVWAADMLAFSGLRREQLPEPMPSGVVVGRVTKRASALVGLSEGTPFVLGGHDHVCACLAAGAIHPGGAVDSSGTAQALICIVPTFTSSAGLANGGYPCYPHVVPGRYVVKGGIKAAGGALDWFVRATLSPAAAALSYELLEAEAEKTSGRSAGPVWLPFLLGTGTPLGDPDAMAALIGLRFEHTSGDLFRSLLEALAFFTRLNLEALAALTGREADRIILLGGATRLKLLSRLKATVIGLPLYVSTIPEAAATGAALLAGIGAGVFADVDEACSSMRYPVEEINPENAWTPLYEDIYREVYLPLYDTLKPIQDRLTSITAR